MMIIKLNHFKVIVPPKRSAYIKSCNGQTKWMCILIEYDDLLKNTILFGIKSALIFKKGLIASLPNPRL